VLLFLFVWHSDRQIKTHHETETEYRDWNSSSPRTNTLKRFNFYDPIVNGISPFQPGELPGNKTKFMQLEINIIQFDPWPYGRDTRIECHKCGLKLHVYAAI